MSRIELEGVRVHNLQNVQVTIPHDAVTVICGVSGAGKSSLAFDTLFAEGQRRYVETFSPHARQFLDQIERPDADRIAGIPPAVAVRQQRRRTNSPGTVGSRTEIARYLRQLFAELGSQHCPECHTQVQSWTRDAITRDLLTRNNTARAMFAFSSSDDASPDDYIRMGFTRGIYQSTTVRLDELPSETAADALSVVVDRVTMNQAARTRIAEAVAQCLDLSGHCEVMIEDAEGTDYIDGKAWDRKTYTTRQSCSACGTTVLPLTADLLNCHSAVGACPECGGLGRIDNGSTVCGTCSGERLNPSGRSVHLRDLRFSDLLQQDVTDVEKWVKDVERDCPNSPREALSSVFRQLHRRCSTLMDLGLDYLSLDRSLTTLSGGELRRVVLTSVLGSGLVNTLYVLDEPTSGMHANDIERIVRCVLSLQAGGNTVVVVEHDLDVIRCADHIVELGPAAGRDGGQIVFQGPCEELLRLSTPTAVALNHRKQESAKIRLRVDTSTDQSWLQVRNVRCHNIQEESVDLPLQQLIAVTGVSGSGKSSLMSHTVVPQLRRELDAGNDVAAGICEFSSGVEHLGDVRLLEQNPLQRSSRSIPATWLGAFDDIRKLLAETHEARRRNFTIGTFSFNSSRGGRCERCHGQGFVTIDMQFLADVEATCEECQGRRFRPDVLEVRYRDRSVDEILQMTAEEAFVFFTGHHRLQRVLNALRQTGLGYLTLGQSLSTLSGGEAQRLRIASLLAGVSGSDSGEAPRKKVSSDSGTLFVLDEPSSGLHAQDTEQIVACLQQLVQVGHTVVIIEHEQRMIEACDYVIVMGPGAGRHGGRVVEQGFVL